MVRNTPNGTPPPRLLLLRSRLILRCLRRSKIIENVAPRRWEMAATTRSGAAALPVRSGEKRWTEAELAKVRKELESEIAELRAEISKSESEIAERMGDAVADAGDDQADAGAKTFQREHE